MTDPEWLARLRPLAKQRPRTQFQRVRWHDLQQLLRERDFLLEHADAATRRAVKAAQREDYGRS